MPAHPAFIHLRLHSEFSILDGTIRIPDAVAKAVSDHMPALALTDLANLFGLVKFYQSAYKNGVKPILGCDVWITNESDRNKPARLILLCQSHGGYLLLSRLLSRAYRESPVGALFPLPVTISREGRGRRGLGGRVRRAEPPTAPTAHARASTPATNLAASALQVQQTGREPPRPAEASAS